MTTWSIQRSMKPVLRLALVAMAVVMTGSSLKAWGPHGEITMAALDCLGTKHPLVTQLGRELPVLTNYCWLPDYKDLPFRVAEEDFYANDYLLFPPVRRHLDHICPEVEQTYEPYFRRALRALQTESAPNAARWIGSL